MWPMLPVGRPLYVEPIDCAESSITVKSCVAASDIIASMSAGATEQMHGDNRLRRWSDRGADLFGRDIKRNGVDVNEYGLCAQPPRAAGCREEREARHDHFIARPRCRLP